MELTIIEGDRTVLEIMAGLQGPPGGGGGGGGSGTVTTINSISPDVSGNITLAAADVGALPTTYVPSYSSITGKPSTFTPSAHTHPASDIASGVIVPARLGTGSATSSTFLRGDGTWQTVSVTAALSGLTDVAIVSAASGDFLRHNGTAWVDYAITKSDVGLGNVDNTSDATKNSAAVALTNKDLTAGTNTFPTFNQNTTGSAAKWTTARLLGGNSVDGTAAVPFANKFVVQGTTDTGLSNAQFLGALGTGLVKNTTTTGVLSIAVTGTDYYAPGGADIPITDGGTGLSTLPTGILVGAGTGAITALTAPSGSIVGSSDTQTLTNKRINPRVVSLVDGATITPNADTTDVATITLGGNRTMAAPTGTPVSGQVLIFKITQDGTGSRTLSWNAAFVFPTGTPTLTTTAGVDDYMTFRFNGATSKWVLQNFTPGSGLTADFNLNNHKLINVLDPVSAQDAATKAYVDGLTAGLLDISDLSTAVPSQFIGITMMAKYNTTTTTWPTLDSGQAANANVSWVFSGGDDAHVPPTVAGNAVWVRTP
jgi:hypothetical protein